MFTQRIIALLLACSLGVVNANAGLMSLTLQADRDLSTLQVGDNFSIEVVLDRMNVGDLTELAAVVNLTLDRLSGPTNELAGPIVPDPSKLDLTTANGGGIDAYYSIIGSIVPNPEISTNGTFFTFDLTAASPGSGVIEFDPATVIAFDVQGAFYDSTDIDTNTLDFNITGNNTVPEPSSIACFALLGVVALRRSFRRKKLASK